MVDQLYKADGDRSHHCKLGKNSTTYLGLMYCYLFALLISHDHLYHIQDGIQVWQEKPEEMMCERKLPQLD